MNTRPHVTSDNAPSKHWIQYLLPSFPLLFYLAGILTSFGAVVNGFGPLILAPLLMITFICHSQISPQSHGSITLAYGGIMVSLLTGSYIYNSYTMSHLCATSFPTLLYTNATSPALKPLAEFLHLTCHARRNKVKEDEEELRLTAKGFTPQSGEDWDPIFDPAAKYASINTIIAIAAGRKIKLHTMDVETAYDLDGNIQNTVYTEQSDGFEEECKADYVCRLGKVIYALSENHVSHAGSKDLDFRHHLLRIAIIDAIFPMQYVSTDSMTADS
jgi:hypothetical protein